MTTGDSPSAPTPQPSAASVPTPQPGAPSSPSPQSPAFASGGTAISITGDTKAQIEDIVLRILNLTAVKVIVFVIGIFLTFALGICLERMWNMNSKIQELSGAFSVQNRSNSDLTKISEKLQNLETENTEIKLEMAKIEKSLQKIQSKYKEAN